MGGELSRGGKWGAKPSHAGGARGRPGTGAKPPMPGVRGARPADNTDSYPKFTGLTMSASYPKFTGLTMSATMTTSVKTTMTAKTLNITGTTLR